MTNATITKLLDSYEAHASSLILTAATQEDTTLAVERLCCAQDISKGMKARMALERDDTAYAVEGVIKRLDKLFVRSKDAVTRDQIRLATRQLRRLVEPETKDTEPIDIFND